MGGTGSYYMVQTRWRKSGVRVVGRYKDLNPRYASHPFCVMFSPFLTKHLISALCGWKQNCASAIGELAMIMYLTGVGATCAPNKSCVPSVLHPDES